MSRRVGWTMGIALALILAMAAAPVASALLAGAIAQSHGCRLDEGAAHPRPIGGVDRGETLTTVFVLGWLSPATIPLGLAGLLVWTLAAVIPWRRAGRGGAKSGALE